MASRGLLLVGLGVVLTGCPKPVPPVPTGDTVKVGVIYSATGMFSPFGEPVGEGIKQAVAEVNAAGGIKGKRVELVIEDDASDPERAAKAFEKLATTDKVLAVVGPTSSSATRATAPLAAKFGIMQITPTAHDSDLAGLPNTFIMFPTVEQTAAKTASLATERFHAKRVAVINADNTWGKQSTTALNRGLTAGGAQLVAAETFKEGQTDFTTIVARVVAQKPDVLVFPGYYDQETIALMKAIRANPQASALVSVADGAACVAVFTTDFGGDPALWKNIFVLDEGGRFQAPGNEVNAAFRQAFTNLYQHAPSPYAAASHAALFAVKGALESSSLDAKQAIQGLRAVKSQTAFGKLDFNEQGMNQGADLVLLQANAQRQFNVVQ